MFLMTYLCLNMKFLNKYRKFLGVFGLVSITILILFYNALLPTKKLPVYQPAMVNFELVDSTIQHQKNSIVFIFLLLIKTVKPLQNDFKGKIYVSDFFLPPAHHLYCHDGHG